MSKPFAPACERNQDYILNELKTTISAGSRILEIGSGTGQHAVYIAPKLDEVSWQCSDVGENIPGIKLWLKEANFNFPEVVEYEVGRSELPTGAYDVVFTANSFHIMSWKKVKTLIKKLGKKLDSNALVCIYGPFNYHGEYTSESNKEFDKWLKERNPSSGIRNFEDLTNNFVQNGFFLQSDTEMPANNRFLVYKKS